MIEGDLRQFDARAYRGIDLVAGGVLCLPFSKADRQLGAEDECDLFPKPSALLSLDTGRHR